MALSKNNVEESTSGAAKQQKLVWYGRFRERERAWAWQQKILNVTASAAKYTHADSQPQTLAVGRGPELSTPCQDKSRHIPSLAHRPSTDLHPQSSTDHLVQAGVFAGCFMTSFTSCHTPAALRSNSQTVIHAPLSYKPLLGPALPLKMVISPPS